MFNNKFINSDQYNDANGREIEDIASKYKVAFHKKKIEQYISGKNIFPVTLELDLTSRCNRNCPDCPSGRAVNSNNLSGEFVDRLLSLLSHNTEGLLLTGGETTLSPLFSSTLKKAREKGFKNIAVVSNGSRLDDPDVYLPLLEHGTSIRVSMYDMNNSKCESPGKVLDLISKLRAKIDKNRSELEIGVSSLTRSEDVELMDGIVNDLISSGVHWVYFHPFCSLWEFGSPTIIDQSNVENEIKRLQNKYSGKVNIYYPKDRYSKEEINFSGYHGSHFLMVVGADGKNYLGAETKYDPSMVIADLKKNLEEGFLWKDERINKISSIVSHSFKAIRSRHRGSLYSDLIDKMKNGDEYFSQNFKKQKVFKYPFIL